MLKQTIVSVYTHRELVREMAWRELKGLNRGALLGSVWLVLSPLIQVAAYVAIVSFVFGQRSSTGGPFDYAVYVLSGMIPWQILLRCLGQAPDLIRERLDLVKKVIYPLETLPYTAVMVSSFGSLVSLLVFLGLGLYAGRLQWTTLLLPLPAALLVAFVVGLSWSLSVAGVLIKDLREIVTITLALLVYVSPVVASEALVGPKVWGYILYNPLAHVVICFRDVFEGSFHPWSWVLFASLAAAAFLSGAWVMTRAKRHIAEYI
ncbi:MAG TPA: hypothetical protein DEA08_01370 [Planctomycetes bacterium]|nr:hypothetical protein [Planctomycetota bacterium]